MDKDTSEISKLTERISKDPKSKLFVPLAEEYKKAGDMEMSIHVLTEGLKNNPGYITAKSLLGRLMLEKGDLAGAQKELEEVVKAIPDNLIAQRKLGDIYALQGKPKDALKQYKTTRSLSPKDEEIASLISDIEAGRDVTKRIAKPKPPEEQGAKPKPAETTPLHTPAAQPAAAAGAATAAHKAGVKRTDMEREEPEEVLVVEPIEAPASQARPAPAESFDFLTEKEHSAPPAEEQPAGLFAIPGDVRMRMPEAGAAPVSVEKAGAEAAASAEKKADDFSTDTLAELYLSQGFYEKSIEIYERMLVDKPDSEGLKNKLAQVRAMAGQTAPAAEEYKIEPGHAPVLEGPVIEAKTVAPFPVGEEEIKEFVPPSSEEFGFGEPKTVETMSAEEELRMETGSLPAFEKPVHDRPGEAAPPAATGDEEIKEFVLPSVDTEFEAVEYQPLGSGKQEDVKMEVQAAPKPMLKRRKETIARLENWLKNIIKEK